VTIQKPKSVAAKTGNLDRLTVEKIDLLEHISTSNEAPTLILQINLQVLAKTFIFLFVQNHSANSSDGSTKKHGHSGKISLYFTPKVHSTKFEDMPKNPHTISRKVAPAHLKKRATQPRILT